jgi:lipopolysaccharide/colanic/teichoic acid biosynthesis glycosyltransferase
MSHYQVIDESCTSLAGEFQSPASNWHYAAKRCFDMAIAAAALVVLAPFFAAVAILIKLDSKGDVLFRQQRWGKGNSIITVFKFRSMAEDLGDVTGIAQTVRDDPRVTRMGRILRKTNIDELPQLINVLLGDMSLVGPRCHAVGMKAAGVLYEDLVPAYHARHRVRPGLTGLAQVRGFRGPTDTAFKARARIKSDLYYIENFSLFLDMQIMLRTVRNELSGGTGF